MRTATRKCDAPEAGPVADRLCDLAAGIVLRCRWCAVEVGACSEAHREGAKRALEAHELVRHPERVRHLVCAIARSEVRSALVFAGAERNPRRWGKLARAVREHLVGGATPRSPGA